MTISFEEAWHDKVYGEGYQGCELSESLARIGWNLCRAAQKDEEQAAIPVTTTYVLTRDVPYEFGEVLGVFSTKELAEQHLEQVLLYRPKWSCVVRSELNINEHILDKP